jgi:PKD repeat protein
MLHPAGYVCVLRSLCVLLGVLVLLSNPISASTLSVPAGGDLQAAIDAAQPGDVIVLEPGATYRGNFTLPVKEGSTDITIRTAPDSRLPGPGHRVDPVLHAALLAKLESGNSGPALQTIGAAHHWRIELLEFRANASGYSEIIRLGRGGTEQTSLDVVPHDLTFDRCYIHGDPVVGQKRGIALNSATTTIRDSHIADMKGVGLDTQAIAGWNGPGPYLIENNYLEGAGENVLFGGADPKIPNLVPSDITFRLNHLAKPRAWMQPVIPAPSLLAATGLAGAGSLPPGTYSYQVVARRPVGQGTIGGSLPSVQVATSLAATGAVRVSWSPVEHATEYRVYGRTASGTMYWTLTGTSFTDTGAGGTPGAPPTAASKWTVKNIFELKNARRVLAEGNVFEDNWAAGQGGVGIVLTPRNQDGTAPWSGVSEVTFRYNIVRRAGGAMSVNGFDTNYPSQQGRDIRIHDNLFYDITSADGAGRFLIMGNQPASVTIDHNTILQTDTILLVYGPNGDGTYDVVNDFHFTNNLTLHNTWGIVGEMGGGLGTASIMSYFGAPTAVQRNVLAGGPAARYPADNLFPDVVTFMAGFADTSYRLRSDSPYKGAGLDGRDLGADIDAIEALTRRALSGDASINKPPSAVAGGPYAGLTFAPVVLDGSGSSDADGNVVSYVWSWSDGCPETAGPSVAHMFPSAGVYGATLTVVDDGGAVATASVSITVTSQPPTAEAGGPYLGEVGAAVAVSATGSMDRDGRIISYRWNWGDGSPEVTSDLLTASHVYAAPGDYLLTLTVTDDAAIPAADTAVVRVSAVPPPAPVSPPEIVVFTAELPDHALHGNWIREPDETAAGGSRLASLDLGMGAAAAPLVSPQHYFDVTFTAKGNTPYRIWLRMAALNNSKWNDSVWVQLSDALNGQGQAVYRLGTTSGLLVNLATEATGTKISGWGWQNTAYWLNQTTVVTFEADGAHTLRVQTREDGVRIDQVVISPLSYLETAPGPVANDANPVSKPLTDIVVYASDVSVPGTWWQPAADASAAAGVRLASPNAGWSSNDAPQAAPVRYFDVTVEAQANMDYRVWLRLNATANNKYNDAVWVQFADASAGGRPRYQIGSTDGLLVNLATTATATSLKGWGWQNGAYWKSEADQPTIVRFPTTGPQTIRVQVREDGVSVDQLVLSPARYLATAPGSVSADATIVAKP